jgi:hypothetical protein
MHKNATECNEILRKWCKNKHGASKIMDTLETYQCAVATREKTTFLCPRTFALFTLHTLLNVVICCLQLNTHGVFVRYPREWIISHRCSWMMVYVFCCNAQSKSHCDPHNICTLCLFYQLANCNLFTQHVVIYFMERHH